MTRGEICVQVESSSGGVPVVVHLPILYRMTFKFDFQLASRTT